jgi:hypothetical protein
MANKKKQQDALKAKQKRQKVMAVGGAVLLLGLLAIQVPRTMKMLNAEAPTPPPAAAPSVVPSDPSVLPTPGTVGGAPSSSASGGGTLVDSDPVPTASTGQLVGFGRFSSKDPFDQQIDPQEAMSAGGDEPAPSDPARPGAPSAPAGGAVAPPSPGGPQLAPGTAIVAVNGVEETVQKGQPFPKDAPLFTLVAVSKGAVKIAVAGGALASGARSVELLAGKTLTLVNTADGTRYEIKLVAAG